MAGVPFKVSVPGMGKSGLQVGVVVNSLKHLGQILEERLGLSQHAQIYLEDGTLVCDQEYFELLEPQTKLTVVEGRDDLQECSLGEKRPLVVPADSASSLPTKQRRTSLPSWLAEAYDSSTLTSNTSYNNNAVSCLRISRVEENVPMQSSPSPTCKPPPPRPSHSSPLRNSYPVMPPPHNHVMFPSQNPHSITSPSHDPPHLTALTPHPPRPVMAFNPITIVPNSHLANPPTLHYQPFPDPINHQQFLLPQQTPSQVLHPQSSLHPQLQPSLIPIPRPQQLLLPQPSQYPIQSYHHPTIPPPWTQFRPIQQESLQHQPIHQKEIQQTLPITQTNCHQQSGVVLFPRIPPDLVLLQPLEAHSQQPDTTVQQEANQQQVWNSQHQVPRQLKRPVKQLSPLIHIPTAHHQNQILPTPLPKESTQMSTLLATVVHQHHRQNQQDIPAVNKPHLATASTPIPGVRAVLGAAQCPVSVVNLCTDSESGEESDDEDKLCIVEDHESSCSGTSGSSNPTVHPRMATPKPSELTIDDQHKPDNHIPVEPPVVLTNPTNASSSLSDAQPRSGSLDEGYSSSTSFSSLTSVINKLPFADFDTGSTPQSSPLPPDCPCEAEIQLWEEQAITPRSPKFDNETSAEGVDISAEVDHHKAIDSEERMKEVSPTNEEASEAEVELLVSIPLQWESGRLLCQDDSMGEEVVATSQAADGGVELVVSIPVCWEDHQIKHITLRKGRCEDLESSKQYVTAGSTSNMDEVAIHLGQCREVGEHACKTNPSEGTGVPVDDEQVVVVEEYACEETVLSARLPQVCTEIDIDRCVAQIMSKVLMLQSEESEEVCAGIEELAVSIPIEYEPVPPSMQAKELSLDTLLTVDNVGNEVVVSCGEEELGDDEAEVCLDFLHLEEVEIEVVDMMDVDEYTTAGAPEQYDPSPFAVKKRLFTEKINHLLHIADALSEEDSREIRGFFSSTPLDPRKGFQRYTLMQHAHDGKYVCLELDFATGKWRGIISG